MPATLSDPAGESRRIRRGLDFENALTFRGIRRTSPFPGVFGPVPSPSIALNVRAKVRAVAGQHLHQDSREIAVSKIDNESDRQRIRLSAGLRPVTVPRGSRGESA